jgi:hypothetical protein
VFVVDYIPLSLWSRLGLLMLCLCACGGAKAYSDLARG